jgi:hypothetical protein
VREEERLSVQLHAVGNTEVRHVPGVGLNCMPGTIALFPSSQLKPHETRYFLFRTVMSTIHES